MWDNGGEYLRGYLVLTGEGLFPSRAFRAPRAANIK